MSSKELIIVSSAVLTMLLTGSVYLGYGNTYSDTYTGILARGEVFTDVSCTTTCNKDSNGQKHCNTNCDNTYYIDQIFYKNNHTTSTCTVRRLKYYYFKGDADNFVSRMILGTDRKLYESTYSHGTCIDNKIRNYYNSIGYSLISISVLFILIFLIWFFFEYISNILAPKLKNFNDRFKSSDNV